MTRRKKPRTNLTEADVRAIKARLWFGETREEVAADVGISIGFMCNIGSGHRWGTIPWPDGSLGGMSEKRAAEISKARREAKLARDSEVKRILQRRRAKKVA